MFYDPFTRQVSGFLLAANLAKKKTACRISSGIPHQNKVSMENLQESWAKVTQFPARDLETSGTRKARSSTIKQGNMYVGVYPMARDN